MISSTQQQMQNNIFIKDGIVPNPCKETISSLSFNSINNIPYFAFSSWDGLINIYSINTTFNPTQSFGITEVKSINCNTPLLSLDFQNNSPLILYGALNGSVGFYDLINQKYQALYTHEIGAREVKWLNTNVLISGGWDGCLFMRDIRINKYISSFQFQNRIYSLDVQGNNMLIGLSEGQFALCELSSNNLLPNIYSSFLKYQITKVALMSNSKAFVIGSNEGGIEVKFIDNNTQFNPSKKHIANPNDYCFVTHINDNNEVYPINCLSFNPNNSTLLSGGGDGICIFWDIEEKKSYIMDIWTILHL